MLLRAMGSVSFRSWTRGRREEQFRTIKSYVIKYQLVSKWSTWETTEEGVDRRTSSGSKSPSFCFRSHSSSSSNSAWLLSNES